MANNDDDHDPLAPLTAERLRGNWATLLTPWTGDGGGVDVARLVDEIEALVAAGVDGIYSHGTAGEFHCQTESEFDAVAQCLADRCRAARMPFQIGVSHMSPQISLERLRRAVALRPGAVQVILPDWFPVGDAEAEWFFERMAATAGDTGLVLYNPPHAKRRLSPEELGRLADAVPTLIGAKLPGGDDAWYGAMRPVFERLSVFVPGHLLASGFARGARGAYSNVACLSPRGAQAWWRQINEDLPAALALEIRIVSWMREHLEPFLAQGYCNAACDRLMASIGSWADVGVAMRWPYRSIPGSEAERLRPITRAALPELFAG